MGLAALVLHALGSPAAYYIPPEKLPPVERMRPPPSERRPARSGGSGTSIISGRIYPLDSNTETSGDKWYGSRGKPGVVALMMRDPHVRQSVAYVTNPLRAATWRFKPASSSPLDREVADFCAFAFLECLPWDVLIERIVGGYATDGFSLSEMTDDLLPVPAARFPLHPGSGTGLVPTGLHEVPAYTVDGWHRRDDNHAQLASVTQWQPYSDGEDSGFRQIPADRLVRLTCGQRGSDFAGVALLRSAYGPWKLKNAFQQLEAIGFERTAVGTPVAVASADATDEDLDAAQSILENMRSMAKGYAIFPNGYEFKWEGAGESDVANLNVAIERCNTDIAVNVTAGFSRLGLTGPGSYALGTTQAGQYHLSTVGHARMLSLAFTLGFDGWSPVRRIVEANYGAGVAVPVLEARNLPTRDYGSILPLLTNAVNAGIVTADDPLEDEVREALQFGPRDPESSRKKAAPLPPFATQGSDEPAGDTADDGAEDEPPADEEDADV